MMSESSVLYYLLVEGVIGTVVLIKVIYITYASNNVYKVVLRMILCICMEQLLAKQARSD
jgi:hypothetical protein